MSTRGMNFAAISSPKETKDAAVTWIGCGECDCIFDCYNGETRCIRLPQNTTNNKIESKSSYWLIERGKDVKFFPTIWYRGTPSTRLDNYSHYWTESVSSGQKFNSKREAQKVAERLFDIDTYTITEHEVARRECGKL